VDALSNPFTGRAMSVMRELCDLLKKGKLEVTHLQHHRDTFGAMNLEVKTRIPKDLHARPRRRKK
jgi:hypothetical protein